MGDDVQQQISSGVFLELVADALFSSPLVSLHKQTQLL